MKSKIIIICGVGGCGKSTEGKDLASKLEIPFFDGGGYHSQLHSFVLTDLLIGNF